MSHADHSHRQHRQRYRFPTVLDGPVDGGDAGEKLASSGRPVRVQTTSCHSDDPPKPSGGFIQVTRASLSHEEAGNLVPCRTSGNLHKMREKIGMVFQHFNLFPHKCVLYTLRWRRC